MQWDPGVEVQTHAKDKHGLSETADPDEVMLWVSPSLQSY